MARTDVRLLLDDKYLTFDIVNNKGVVDATESTVYSGIGLENVRKRVELTYGKETAFQIENKQEQFRVIIKFCY